MKKNGITTGKALIIVMLFSLMATTTLALEGNGDWFTVLARTSGNNVDGSPPTNGDIIQVIGEKSENRGFGHSILLAEPTVSEYLVIDRLGDGLSI